MASKLYVTEIPTLSTKKGRFQELAENRGSPTKTGRLEFLLTSTAHFIKAVTPPQNETIEEFTNCPAL